MKPLFADNKQLNELHCIYSNRMEQILRVGARDMPVFAKNTVGEQEAVLIP